MRQTGAVQVAQEEAWATVTSEAFPADREWAARPAEAEVGVELECVPAGAVLAAPDPVEQLLEIL